MKGLMLLLVQFLTLASLASNDTLTVAQVYNFNVGDTFDYRTNWQLTFFPSGSTTSGFSLERDVVTDIHTMGAQLVIVMQKQNYNYNWVDSIVLDSLNNYTVFHDTGCAGPTTVSYNLDSSSNYNGRKLNGVKWSCFESGSEDMFVEGLGKVFSEFDNGYHPPDAAEIDTTFLIYYAKGAERWGTPYYVANGSTLIHYTPIPEQCATWVSTITEAPFSYNVIAQEEITTGNRIWNNGHTFVEMMGSYINFQDGTNYSNSLAGYFRNDTVNRKAYLYNYLTDTVPFLTYDFNQTIGGEITGMGQVSVGGQPRTAWYADCSQSGAPFTGFIEGVGGRSGLYPMHTVSITLGAGPTARFCGSLTCFSVCGNVLYPNDSTASCSFLVGLENLNNGMQAVNLFPTVNDGSFKVSLAGNTVISANLIVYDLLGQQKEQVILNNGLNEIKLSAPPSGMYLYNITNGNRIIQSGKFIIQR